MGLTIVTVRVAAKHGIHDAHVRALHATLVQAKSKARARSHRQMKKSYTTGEAGDYFTKL